MQRILKETLGSREVAFTKSKDSHTVSLDYLQTQDSTIEHAYGKRLGPPLRAFCDHPWPKSGSRSMFLEKAIESRRLLAVFWQQVRDEHAKHWVYNYHNENIPDRIATSLTFDLAPEYLAAAHRERGEYTDISQASSKGNTEMQSSAQTEWGTAAPSSAPMPSRRTKTKTTGLPPVADPRIPAVDGADEEADDASSQQPDAMRVAVQVDSMSVFDKMFCAGGASYVKWTQLVHALVDADMVATQVPGSGVKFANDYGSIVFDKPHPEPEVSAVMLRRQVGRRLNKWVGWEKEIFVLRERV